jgi:hypothetical protein
MCWSSPRGLISGPFHSHTTGFQTVRNRKAFHLRYPTSEMAKRRGPYTDPRQGRVLQQIDRAYVAFDTDTLDASVLMEWAYGAKVIRKLQSSRTGKPQKWPYEMLKRALMKVATPIGRSTKRRGRPMLWKLDPERAALRGRRRREKGLNLAPSEG